MKINEYSIGMTLGEYIREWRDELTTEWCPHCNTEVDIPVIGESHCPNCGELIVPCNMCDSDIVNCSECVWRCKYDD